MCLVAWDGADITVASLVGHLTADGRNPQICHQFRTLKSNADRVDFVYRLLDEYKLLPSLTTDGKRDKLSADMRMNGNEMFKEKRYAEANEFYSKSVALASIGSEEMALAYANRSAVLLEKGYYKECLVDINRALENAYPERLKPKLSERQAKANELKAKQLKRNYFEPIPEITNNEKNESIQCAANSVEIRYTIDDGRHVVATRDISPGEIISVEEVFCHILLEEYYTHCHDCLKLCYNLIPCKECTQVMYCSESCRDNAYHYHRYECVILASMKALEIDKLKLLPLKIALLVKDQYPIIKSLTNVSDGLYRSDRYKEIHNLLAHTSKRSVSDMFDRAVISALLFYFVKQFTDFLQEKQEEEEEIFKELILLHMQVSGCNALEISEFAKNKDNECVSVNTIAGGLYSFQSIVNHRCSPNIVNISYGTVLVTRAIESIKKGQQCCINYGFHHYDMSKFQRQQNLQRRYFFNCKCDVCINIIRIDFRSLIKLQQGDIQTAKKVLQNMLPKMKQLERSRPNINQVDLQLAIKQCYSLLGNFRKF